MSRSERFSRAILTRGTGRRPGHKGYWVQWQETVDGVRRRRRACCPTRDAALRFAARKTNELNAPLVGRVTWSLMVQAFADAIAPLAESSQVEYLATLNVFRQLVGEPHADGITPQLVQQFVAKRSPAVSPQTLRKDLRNLRRFFRWCMAQEPPWLLRDPTRAITPPRAPKVLIRVPSVDDVSSLLAACGRTDYPLEFYCFCRLAFETGLRANDLLRLEWRQLRYEPEIPNIFIDTTAGKTARQGVWALTRGATAALESLREARGHTARLFHWQVIPQKPWQRLRRDAGLKALKLHSLRAAAATVAATADSGLARAQRLLQHGSARTTATHYLDAVQWALVHARCLESLALPPPPPSNVPPAASRPGPSSPAAAGSETGAPPRPVDPPADAPPPAAAPARRV